MGGSSIVPVLEEKWGEFSGGGLWAYALVLVDKAEPVASAF